ncbi:MAG: MFS transporter [Anaerolineae bacterium]|nr:MFS transporter [Anaerolineae bacterium]
MQKNRSFAPKGMRTFYTIWVGQLISTLGSGLTGFAMGVWVYQETESVTLFAINILAFTIPSLIVSPFAGQSPTVGTVAQSSSLATLEQG